MTKGKQNGYDKNGVSERKNRKPEIHKGIDWDQWEKEKKLGSVQSKKKQGKNNHKEPLHSDARTRENGKKGISSTKSFVGKNGNNRKKAENERGRKIEERVEIGKGVGNRNVRKQKESFGRGISGEKSINAENRQHRKAQTYNGKLQHEALCPVAKKCGSCAYQRISYAEQLHRKQAYVNGLLSRYGRVEPIIGMKNPLHYRNKVHAVFDRDRRGKVIAGTYQEGTHEVVNVESCMIEDERADAIMATIKKMLPSFKIKTYDEDTGYGLLRHVLVRDGRATGEYMVVLVLSSPILPSKNNFVKALRSAHPEITTILIHVNNKKTSMVLGDKEHVLYGKGYIEDQLCGLTFRISPRSFYQVNPEQTEKLYEKAMELAGLSGRETVLDAYCGIGTIGMVASLKSQEVIGVELNPEAVRDAVANARRNQLHNIRFYQNDAGRFMTELAVQNALINVVFMDPPRAGADEAFLTSLLRLAPEKIVYISCNPESLVRDLDILVKRGYQAKTIVPVDQFPFSKHVECVVLMSRVEK